MDWRNCAASLALIAEVNTKWPNRDKTSDGTIGDAAHASRSSDHNPFIVVRGTGVVRARDIDVDGIDAGWLAEWLRKRAAAGDPRLSGGGYVIFNRRITRPDWGGWRIYTGTNPHTHHLHLSFSLDVSGFDSDARWGLDDTAPAPTTPAGGPELDAAERKMLTEIHGQLGNLFPDRVDFGLVGQREPATRGRDTVGGHAVSAHARAFEVRELVRALRTEVAALGRLVESQQAAIETVARLAGQSTGLTPEHIKDAVTAAIRDNVVRVQIGALSGG